MSVSKSPNAQTEELRETAGRSTEDRVTVAKALGLLTARSDLTPEDRDAAHRIIEMLSQDAEMRVRQAVVHAVENYPLLPATLAEQIAKDVADVSGPLLESSPVLSTSFLTDLVASGTLEDLAQIRLARRRNLEMPVADKLLEAGRSGAVEAVLSNETAQIGEKGYSALLEREVLDDGLFALVSQRKDLPAAIVADCHRIALDDVFGHTVRQQVRDRLMSTYALPEEMAAQIVQAAVEDMLAHTASESGGIDGEFELVARRLYARNELTPTLLLRVICSGALEFAEAAFHVLTCRPREEVANAFAGAGREAMDALYKQSGLDAYFRFAVVAATKRVAADEERATDKTLKSIVDEIVGFYRGIGPGPVDEVISRLTQEAERWR